ncbi:MAG: NusG domain II-containing protein [bacterium]
MDRRNFIKQCTLIVSGFTVSKGVTLLPNSLFAKDIALSNFSLNLITNNPDKAVLKVEDLIKNSNLKHKNVKFMDYTISGNHIGDIVLIRDNNLIDFRVANDELSKNVLEISKELGFPKNLENPVFMKFFTENPLLTPKYIKVFHENILIKQFEMDADIDSYAIKGSKGYVTISIKNKNVNVISSSCKHKTCIKMGSINKPGQNLVCIPNQIRVSIDGDNEYKIDSLSY